MLANRRERHSIENRGPPFGCRVRSHRTIRTLDKPPGKVCGKRRSGLWRTRRLTQGADRAAIVEQRVELGQPLAVLGVDPLSQTGFQLFCERSALVVFRAVFSRHDDLAQVTEVDLVHARKSGFGVVAPFSSAKLGKELLADRFKHLGRNLWLFGLLCYRVLLLDEGSHTWDPVA